MESIIDLKYNPGMLITLVVLPPLVFFGNPALALLVSSVLTILLNRSLLPFARTLGRYSLQSAIILLGLKLNVQRLWDISADYSLLVTGYVLLTLTVGVFVGLVLRTERNSARLISSATAVCGGTTIVCLAPIIRARADQTAVALAIVFILNAIALLVFPLIGEFLNLSQTQFGIWAALAIHDTSSVVATAAVYGDEAADIATTLKLGRTLWLIPVLLTFSILERSDNANLRIPGFIIAFLAASILGSVVPLPLMVLSGATLLSKALLVCALFCVGCEIDRATLKKLRGAPVLHALLLWMLIAPGTLAIIFYLY